jgi:hypothetical protein
LWQQSGARRGDQAFAQIECSAELTISGQVGALNGSLGERIENIAIEQVTPYTASDSLILTAQFAHCFAINHRLCFAPSPPPESSSWAILGSAIRFLRKE